ncbi:MAG TPA: hypothetical protein VGM02_01610 [Acidobacteriaceae bacterium]
MARPTYDLKEDWTEKQLKRADSPAAIVNSLRRAESLSPDQRIMDRAVLCNEARARDIIAAWEPRLGYKHLIVTVEASIDA